jgi:hypothetical protein
MTSSTDGRSKSDLGMPPGACPCVNRFSPATAGAPLLGDAFYVNLDRAAKAQTMTLIIRPRLIVIRLSWRRTAAPSSPSVTGLQC